MTCGHTYSEKNHFSDRNTNGTCYMCGEKLFNNSIKSITYSSDRRTITLVYNVKPTKSITPVNVFHYTDSGGFNVDSTSYSQNSDGSYDLKYVCSVTTYPHQMDMYLEPRMYYTRDGVQCLMKGDFIYFYPDGTAPSISTVNQTDIKTVNGWATSKQFTVTGAEAYSDGVYVRMTDESGNIVYPESYASVSNGSYSFSFIPEIEAATDTKFYIYIKDKSKNESRKEVIVSRLDGKTPELKTETVFNQDWKAITSIKFVATDNGVGQVKMSFNDENNYQTTNIQNNEYYYEYKFSGDVYEDRTAMLYVKDGLDNVLAQKITFGKIDSTSPTITNISKEKSGLVTKITIQANDINQTLNKEGSGIVGYAITRSKENPKEEDFQESNIFEKSSSGTYYVWVKDKAGNLAERTEIEI